MSRRRRERGCFIRSFECIVCGKTNFARKKIGMTRDGHIKTFYCMWCQQVTEQVQTDISYSR